MDSRRKLFLLVVVLGAALLGLVWWLSPSWTDPRQPANRSGEAEKPRGGFPKEVVGDQRGSPTGEPPGRSSSDSESVPSLLLESKGPLVVAKAQRAIDELVALEHRRMKFLGKVVRKDGGAELYGLVREPDEKDSGEIADVLKKHLSPDSPNSDQQEFLRSLREELYQKATSFPRRYKLVLLSVEPTGALSCMALIFDDPGKVDFNDDGDIHVAEEGPLSVNRGGAYTGVPRYRYLLEEGDKPLPRGKLSIPE